MNRSLFLQLIATQVAALSIFMQWLQTSGSTLSKARASVSSTTDGFLDGVAAYGPDHHVSGTVSGGCAGATPRAVFRNLLTSAFKGYVPHASQLPRYESDASCPFAANGGMHFHAGLEDTSTTTVLPTQLLDLLGQKVAGAEVSNGETAASLSRTPFTCKRVWQDGGCWASS